MKTVLLSLILIFTCYFSFGQNLVGYQGKEIKKYMKENCQDMSQENVSNSKFSYLKYSDTEDSQTLLFFLDCDSICKSIKMICDIRVKTEKVKEFNSIYKIYSENKWIDTRNGKNYLIEIRNEQWSYNIIIEPFK
jgi:hypothetical protein